MINRVEWSGVLFIRKLEGDLDNPDSLKFEAIDLFLMDIGTAGTTGFKWDSDIVDAYDQNEELMEEGVRTALIHSHHGMKAFFSPTDKEELQDNTPEDVDMYLSLVVNNDLHWDCKISMFGEHTVQRQGFFKKLGQAIVNQNFTFEKKEKVLFIIDVKIFLDGFEVEYKRIEQLENKKKAEEKIRETQRIMDAKKNPQLQIGQGTGGNGFGGGRPFSEDLDDNQYIPDWRQPPVAKSLATGNDIPEELGKLLMLNTEFDGDFEMALNSLEETYKTGQGMAMYLAHFRSRYHMVLAELKKIALDGKEDEPAWEYEMTADLLDEILQWRGNKNTIFKGLTEALEIMVDQYDEQEGEESMIAPTEQEIDEVIDQIKNAR